MSSSALEFGPIRHLSVSTGVKIAYVDTGQQQEVPTLLFLHGLATYAMSWRPNIAELRHRYRCIAIDLPGFGHSTHGDHPFTMSFFANSVIDFIGQLGLERVCLIGHSMGGQIAMNMVLTEPRCADRLILCGTAGFFSDDETSLRQVLYASFYRFPPDAEKMTSELVALFRKQPREQYKQTIDRCMQGMLEGSVYDRLPMIKQPALIIFGEEDALIPAKFYSRKDTKQLANDGASRLPNSRLHVLPKAGHFVHWEKATVVNRMIDDWLQNRNPD
jgi:pimeloyl-ACP methyl ester carboxylesterase